MFFHWYWCINTPIFSVAQWFNSCLVVNKGSFRLNGRTGLLLGPSQSPFLCSIKQEPLDFQFCVLPGASCCSSLVSSLRSSPGEWPFGPWQFWSMDLLRMAFLAEVSARCLLLASRISAMITWSCKVDLLLASPSVGVGATKSWLSFFWSHLPGCEPTNWPGRHGQGGRSLILYKFFWLTRCKSLFKPFIN